MITYDIDAEKKTVSGTYVFDRRAYIVDKLSNTDNDYIAAALLPEEDIVTIKAHAVCQDGDEFNEQYGMGLVEAKIYSIKHQKIMSALNRMYSKVSKFNDALLDVGVYHYRKGERIKKDMREYYKLERK